MAGEYRLIVPPTRLLNARSVWALQPVTVTGASSQTVFVPTNQTMEVTGRILFDGSPTLLPGVRVFLTVNLVAEGGNSRVDPLLLPEAFGHVDGAGFFTITGVMPGRYTFTVSGADARGWNLEGATIPAAPGSRVADRDVFNLPFEVTNGLDITDVKLSMTRAASTLQVMLRDEDDRPVGNLDVVLFAADPKYWSPASGRLLRARANPSGVATFDRLPKGDYIVAAGGAVGAPDWQTVPRLEAVAAAGTKVRLEAGETRAITVRIASKTLQ
jgi:hypothetical protein